jgi:multiple sugar transport system substrate-binding protein
VPSLRSVPSISTWPEIERIAGPILEIAMYEEGQPDTLIEQLDLLTRDLFAEAGQR